MNPFIEECRKEWKRLRVPDAVANEMATDLASDLAEAEADGVSPEAVLGSAAFDPRSFAAAWAEERGVIPFVPVRAATLWRAVNPLVIASVSLLGALVATLFLVASRNGSSISVEPQAQGFAASIRPDHVYRLTAVHLFDVLAGILLVLAILGMALSAYMWMSRRRSGSPFASA